MYVFALSRILRVSTSNINTYEVVEHIQSTYLLTYLHGTHAIPNIFKVPVK